MDLQSYYNVFRAIGSALNSPIESVAILERAAAAMVDELGLKGCQFRLLSRDGASLEHLAAAGLSADFLGKGPVDAGRSISEALRGNVIMVADATTDPRIQYPDAFVREGIAAVLTVPLATRGQVIGVMRLFTSEPREFGPEEIGFFTTAALFCTSAVTHGMFHSILQHVTTTVSSSLELDEVLDSIVRVVTEDLRIKGCTIRLREPRTRGLELRAAFGLSTRYLERASASPGAGVVSALEGRPVAILEAGTDPRVRHRDEAALEGVGSMLFVPMMVRDQAIGVLSLYTHRPYQFSADETQLMMAIGEQCALAIRNAQMFTTVKRQYETAVDDFHQWFEHYHTGPTRPAG